MTQITFNGIIYYRGDKMTKVKFADVSAFQPSSLPFFMDLWNKGYRGVVVKVTEGEYWKSPVWLAQVSNALKAGFQVGLYHFARWSSPQNAITEANDFLNTVKAAGLDKSTVAMVDCETNDYHLSGATYQQCIKNWINTVKGTYPITSVYASKYWWTNFISPYDINGALVWLAGYGISDFGGITNVAAWQWDDGKRTGTGVDTSWDYNGAFTSAETVAPGHPATKPAPHPAPVVHYSGYRDSLGDFWYYEKGTFTSNTSINLRWGARTSSSIIATLPAGSEVKYDAFSLHGGYVWLRQPRGNGYGYLASGHETNGRRTDYWGTFK